MSNNPPRVVHLNLARGFRGGERQTELLLRELPATGWPQVLVARRGEPLLARCTGLPGVECRPVRGRPGALAALRDADLVHVHEGRSVQLGWLNRLLRGTPYLITRRVQQGPRQTRINRLMYRGAAARVALSAAIAAALRTLDPALESEIIPSVRSGLAVDAREAARLREAFGGGFVAGHVGALVDAHKGQMLIIGLARRLRERCPDAVFVLVGSGADEGRLRAAAAGLDNLRFAGQVDNVGDYLAAFDLFLYPSRHEGLGSILLDAMAQGLPVLASNAGGIPEVIADGVNGLLFPAGDAGALEAAFLRLYQDPALREAQARRNRVAAAGQGPGLMAQRYAQLYLRLLQGTGQGVSSS